MKLASFQHAGGAGFGRLEGDHLIDLSASGLPNTLLGLLEAGPEAMQKARVASGTARPLSAVTLLQPVLRPPKILAIGLNYADHIAETKLATPTFPMFFNKQSTAAVGPYAPIHLPRVSDQLDYEGELGFIIGRRCRHVPRERAHEVARERQPPDLIVGHGVLGRLLARLNVAAGCTDTVVWERDPQRADAALHIFAPAHVRRVMRACHASVRGGSSGTKGR